MQHINIRLTDEQLSKIITETVHKTLNKLCFLKEHGIDVDRENLEITYNPKHQRNLDTSIENNPTFTTEVIEGMTVNKYSLFQRKKNDKGDGNPMLYALKKEKDWVLTNKKDFFEQLDLVLDKFLEEHTQEVVIPIPSTNLLNNDFLTRIVEKLNDVVVCQPLTKMSTEEIWEACEEKDSYFRKYWQEKGVDLNQAYESLSKSLIWMDKNNDGIFSFHYVKDMNMRESIINTMKCAPEEYTTFNKDINGKDVLLIDDSITKGQSIRDAIHALKELYEPRSISVLTIFSDLKYI